MIGVVTDRRLTLGGQADPRPRERYLVVCAGAIPDRDVPAHDTESLSVYWSLLLRGAIAAAEHDDRHTAHELPADAEDADARLGEDSNLRWTAFGPTNAQLHQVNIAVILGDAGPRST